MRRPAQKKPSLLCTAGPGGSFDQAPRAMPRAAAASNQIKKYLI
jgi:hypothetical protein